MSELSKKEQLKIGKDFTIRVGKNIRQIRKSKDITQTELSDRIFSDRQYLYKIEHGKVGLSVSKLMVISLALEVPIEDLVK